jgi:stress response protein SCP2
VLTLLSLRVQHRHVGLVDYCHRQALDRRLTHSTDQVDEATHTGHHEICVDLANLPLHVHSLFFVLSSWKAPLKVILQPSVTLAEDRRPASASASTSTSSAAAAKRAVSPQPAQLCTYELEDKDPGTFSSVIMCVLYRERPEKKEWRLRAIGEMGHGYADNYGPIEELIATWLRDNPLSAPSGKGQGGGGGGKKEGGKKGGKK